MISLALVVLGCLIFSGCARTIMYGAQQIPSSVGQIRKGWSTKEDVITMLGNPAQVTRSDLGEEVLVYEAVTERPRASIWSVIFFDIGSKPGMKKQTTRLTVTLDSIQVVRDYKVDELYTEYLVPAYGDNNAAAHNAAIGHANIQRQHNISRQHQASVQQRYNMPGRY